MAEVAIRFRTEGADEAQQAFEKIAQSSREASEAAKQIGKGKADSKFDTKELQNFNAQLQEGVPAASSFREALSAIADRAKEMAGPVGAAAAAIGLLGIKMGLTGLKEAENMRILAKNTNLTVEALSRLKYASEITDVPFAQLAQTAATLQKTLVAQKGPGFDKLMELGLFGAGEQIKQGKKIIIDYSAGIKAFMDLSPEKQFEEIASGLQKITNENERLGTLQQLFKGKSNSLYEFFLQTPQEIRAMNAELEHFGGVISTATAQNADAFYDSLTKLNTAIGNVRKNVAEDLAPDLRKLAEALAFLAKDSGALKALTVILSALAQVLLFVAKVVATVVVSISAAFGDLGTIIGALGAALAAFSRLEFARGAGIIKDAMGELAKRGDEAKKAIQGLWDILKEPPPSIANEAEKASKGLDKLQKNAFKAADGFRAMKVSWDGMSGSFQQTGGFVKTGPAGQENWPGAEEEGQPQKIPSRDDWNEMMYEVRGFARDFTNEINDMLWDSEQDWEDYFKSIGKMITRIILQQTISKPLEEFISGIKWGSIFGGDTSGQPTSTGGDSPVLTTAAGGGVIPAGSWGLVGEEGPELIGPVNKARGVVSNDQLGGPTIVQNFGVGVSHAELAPILSRWRMETIAAVTDLNRRSGRT